MIAAALVIFSTACDADTVNGWPVEQSTALEAALEPLDGAIRNDEYKLINSVVIIRAGKLVFERYYNGAERDDIHNPRSVGKTFVSPLLGLALEHGYLDSLDQRLGEFYDLEAYPNYSEKKARVTLRQLANMASGFEGFDFVPESIGNEENMYPEPDWVKWTLSLPMSETREPGDEWRYFTAGIVLLGDILNRVLPGGLENYAHLNLFEPLGIDNYQWQHTPQRVANTAGGIQLTPLGFAKFGELHRRNGMWGEHQVVPADWVQESLTPVIDTTVEGDRYGMLWWHKSYTVNGDEWTTAYCSGNGGNKIFVFPARELVVVVTASAYGQRYMHTQVDDMMENHILPAVAADR
jgi:CubicO group peptidase (beta-lactamase class C family)